MNALEDRLRDGLRQLADDASDQVNPEQAIVAGNRALTRGRAHQAVGGIAAATLVGVTGWFMLAPYPVTVQPAGPAVPAVTMAPSVGPLPTQFFRFDTEPTQGSAISYLVTVKLNSDGARLNLNVSSQREFGGEQQSGELSGAIGTFFTGVLPGNLRVAIIPDEIAGFELDFDPADPSPPVFEDAQIRPDHNNGLTLVVIRQEPIAEPPRFFWVGSDGAVRDSSARVMQTLTLNGDDEQLRVFQQGDGSAWGTFPSDVVDVWRTVDPDRAEVRVMTPRGMSVGRLPVGATDATVVPREGASGTVGTMPDGRVWWLAQYSNSGHSDSTTKSLVHSISYTDASGKRVTFEPKLAG